MFHSQIKDDLYRYLTYVEQFSVPFMAKCIRINPKLCTTSDLCLIRWEILGSSNGTFFYNSSHQFLLFLIFISSKFVYLRQNKLNESGVILLEICYIQSKEPTDRNFTVVKVSVQLFLGNFPRPKIVESGNGLECTKLFIKNSNMH